jgi:hypothetical protein
LYQRQCDKLVLEELFVARGKKHTPEQIVSLLRQIEGAVANGKTTPSACREDGINEQTYYRWRKEYGGLQVDQARRLKELEQENSKLSPQQAKTACRGPRLKRLVEELSLDKLVLKDIASGNFQARNDDAPPHGRRPVRGDPGLCGKPCSRRAWRKRAASVPTGESATRHAALPADAAGR